MSLRTSSHGSRLEQDPGRNSHGYEDQHQDKKIPHGPKQWEAWPLSLCKADESHLPWPYRLESQAMIYLVTTALFHSFLREAGKA